MFNKFFLHFKKNLRTIAVAETVAILYNTSQQIIVLVLVINSSESIK